MKRKKLDKEKVDYLALDVGSVIHILGNYFISQVENAKDEKTENIYWELHRQYTKSVAISFKKSSQYDSIFKILDKYFPEDKDHPSFKREFVEHKNPNKILKKILEVIE